MTDFTRQEKLSIERGMVALRQIVESDSKADRWLDEAYRYERRERSTKTWTERLLIESFLDGWHDSRDHQGATPFFLADGCGKLYVLGCVARYERERAREQEREQYRFIVTDAQEAILHGAKEAAKAADARRWDRAAS